MMRKYNTDQTDDVRFVAALDRQEFVVESIVAHTGQGKNKYKYMFKVHWSGYDDNEDTWLAYKDVSKLEALDAYVSKHPELQGVL